MTLARGSGGSVEPPKQRSAAPAEAVSFRLLTIGLAASSVAPADDQSR